TGDFNACELPHLRQDCPRHSFEASSRSTYCANCFCFVCDGPAPDCQHWLTHCQATNRGPEARKWKALRR
ncbi:hypothetical protein JKP88DRAFT_154157, partial [Tribonema minus]